jgi:hypothetical protein
VDEFVAKLLRLVDSFASEVGVERAWVELELVDGARYTLDAISAEPGYGFVTLTPYREPDDDETPERLVIPLSSVKRIELQRAEEQRARFGFNAPAA